MSLSGYDSEAVGFDSITENKELDKHNSTQTSEYSETVVETQTSSMKDCGVNTSDEYIGKRNSADYSAGLNEFLNRVVPAVLEQLDLNEREANFVSSDSDEEEITTAELIQEINVNLKNLPKDVKAAGDNTSNVILDVSFSSIGNSLALSTGKINHDELCEHNGVIKIYNAKTTEDNKFVHAFDINEKSCVSVLNFHPNLPLLAYGTVSGDIRICNMRYVNEDGQQIKAPSDCHETKRISCLYWSSQDLSNSLLALKLTGKRKGASDQVLISSGGDGSINVWQVNLNLNVFENIVCYRINGINKSPAEDLTCFDFAKRVSEVESDDTFVVGTKIGGLFVCKTKSYQQIVGSNAVDPVFNTLDVHATCILNVCFNANMKHIFASISIDSALKIYDINQKSPLKVIIIEQAPTCIRWLSGPILILGLALVKYQEAMVKLINVETGKIKPLEGFYNKHDNNNLCVTAIEIKHSSICRVAVGNNYETVLLWNLPLIRTRFTGKY